MTEEKCLVTEAMDKCQCKICKISRQMRDFNIKLMLQSEMMKVARAGVITK